MQKDLIFKFRQKIDPNYPKSITQHPHRVTSTFSFRKIGDCQSIPIRVKSSPDQFGSCRRMLNAPGTVHGRNGEGIVTGIVQKLDKVIAGDDTRGDNIAERHGCWFLIYRIIKEWDRCVWVFRTDCGSCLWKFSLMWGKDFYWEKRFFSEYTVFGILLVGLQHAWRPFRRFQPTKTQDFFNLLAGFSWHIDYEQEIRFFQYKFYVGLART